MRQIAQAILTGLSAIIVAASCGAWLLFGVSHMGWKALSIPTGSMRPAIQPGSLVLVKRVPVIALHVGDVITYADPVNTHKTITHRVVKTYLLAGRIPSFITKGDANASVDPAVVGGAVEGKVVASVPYAGTAISWMRSWVGISLLVYIPAVLITGSEVKKLSRYYRMLLPYRLLGYRRSRSQEYSLRPVALPVFGLAVLVAFGAAWAPAALAALHTHTVSLAHNSIRVDHGHNGKDEHDTEVDIDSGTDQESRSGAATNDQSDGSAQSGNAQNTNNTTVNVQVNH